MRYVDSFLVDKLRRTFKSFVRKVFVVAFFFFVALKIFNWWIFVCGAFCMHAAHLLSLSSFFILKNNK
jgi:hypothetical protein